MNPLRFDAGIAFRRSVRNNPVVFIDPAGLWTTVPPGRLSVGACFRVWGGKWIQISIGPDMVFFNLSFSGPRVTRLCMAAFAVHISREPGDDDQALGFE